MLGAIGVGSLEDLFADIPESVRLGREIDLPPGRSEQEVYEHLAALAARNRQRRGGDHLPRGRHVRPLRPGADRHAAVALRVPHAVHAVPARDLAGRAPGDVRVPDGDLGADRPAGVERVGVRGAERGGGGRLPREARDEAAPSWWRAAGSTRTRAPRSRRTRPATAWRSWRSPLDDEGAHRRRGARGAVDDDTAAVFVQQPNFLGTVEDLGALVEAGKRTGAMLVCAADPIPLSILKPPGELGVDLCVGEGQTLGNRLDFGGPSFGFFAADERFIRKMPGRIAGETRDVDGRRGFVLTLQTREQHIRREKATHNICTAQALNALAGVDLPLLARQARLRRARRAAPAAHALRARGARPRGDQPGPGGARVRRAGAGPGRRRSPAPARPGSTRATRCGAIFPSSRTGFSLPSRNGAPRSTSIGWRGRRRCPDSRHGVGV